MKHGKKLKYGTICTGSGGSNLKLNATDWFVCCNISSISSYWPLRIL